jgi:cytochrome c oxidase subunit 2
MGVYGPRWALHCGPIRRTSLVVRAWKGATLRSHRHRRPLPLLPRLARLARLAPAVLLLAGCAPQGVTEQGRDVENLYNFFLVAAAVVWLLVTGLMVWSMVRYRRRGDELPPQTHGNNKLELAWTILPTILVIVLFVATAQTQNRVTAKVEDPAVQVDVLGFQWQWRFTYADPAGGAGPEVVGTPNRVPELVVPQGEPVRIRLSSADVTHSFYVPQSLFKRMAIPGRTTEFDMTFDRPGLFPGNCPQYCGLQHARMIFNVRVLPADQYDQWFTEQLAAAGDGT